MHEGIGFRKHTEDSRLVWQGGVIGTVWWGPGPVGRAVKAWGGAGCIYPKVMRKQCRVRNGSKTDVVIDEKRQGSGSREKWAG